MSADRTPAEELRAAAAKLRETANRIPTDIPTTGGGDYYRSRFEHANLYPGDLDWIALVHPGLAEPFAAVLDAAAEMYEWSFASCSADLRDRLEPNVRATVERELAVARVLNGGA